MPKLYNTAEKLDYPAADYCKVPPPARHSLCAAWEVAQRTFDAVIRLLWIEDRLRGEGHRAQTTAKSDFVMGSMLRVQQLCEPFREAYDWAVTSIGERKEIKHAASYKH